jgi:hypothetical protein
MALALWVTSLCADIEWAGGDPQRSVHLAGGCMIVGVENAVTTGSTYLLEPHGWTCYAGTGRPIVWWFAGYDPKFYTRVWVPMWFIATIALTVSGSAWRFKRRLARRIASGCCRGCGYDRRGLHADGACPECGAVPASG